MEEIERMIFGAFTPGMKAIMELDSIGYKEWVKIHLFYMLSELLEYH
jgi:hypothetical protein